MSESEKCGVTCTKYKIRDFKLRLKKCQQFSCMCLCVFAIFHLLFNHFFMLLLSTLFISFDFLHELLSLFLSHFPSLKLQGKKNLIVFRLNCISLPCHCFAHTKKTELKFTLKRKEKKNIAFLCIYFYHHGITWARRREWFFPRNLKNFSFLFFSHFLLLNHEK